MYDQGSEFISNEFIIYIIKEEYGTTANPGTLGNTTSNAIWECIHQVLGNQVWTYNIKESYVDKEKKLSGILAAT